MSSLEPHLGACGLDGQVAVVTGASQGIGAAVARRLAQAGADVAVHFRGDEQGARAVVDAVSAAGRRAIAGRADLAVDGQAEAFFARVRQDLGPATVVVNAAGAYPTGTLLETALEDWRRVLDDNLLSTVACTRAAVPDMRRAGGGSIVNISSIAALAPATGQPAYSAAKAAVLMLTRSCAQELGPDGIRVNAVSPGLVARPGLEDQWPDGVGRWLSSAPLERLGTPRDVAEAVLFLAAPSSRWTTGANLTVDGGMTSASLY